MKRREFLKKAVLGAGLLFYNPLDSGTSMSQQLEFGPNQKIGRNCLGGMLNIRARPSANSSVIKSIYEDTRVTWQREVIGDAPAGVYSRKWGETPEGYIYSPSLQPCYNLLNTPLTELPTSPDGPGFWGEVTVPYVDIYPVNPPASPWLKEIINPRLYYSQVLWIDDIRQNPNGKPQYHVIEKYGSYGDVYWADAEAFRQITEEETMPISPDVENKKIVIDIKQQTLSCYEGNSEVYFCRVSTGAQFDISGNRFEEWSTPLGEHPIWRKLISIHMSGGGTGAGWDTPGVPWTCLFVGEGVAIHSTFWHNDFGTPRSHGCVNATAEDAKWIFRWTNPPVDYYSGDITIQGLGQSTTVDVIA